MCRQLAAWVLIDPNSSAKRPSTFKDAHATIEVVTPEKTSWQSLKRLASVFTVCSKMLSMRPYPAALQQANGEVTCPLAASRASHELDLLGDRIFLTATWSYQVEQMRDRPTKGGARRSNAGILNSIGDLEALDPLKVSRRMN